MENQTMKLEELYLYEAPLPPDWDRSIYDERVPFAKRIRYAQARAEKVGTGSSRVAFVIPYQGRKTVLKIAKSRRGMAQQGLEAEILSDGYHGRRGITIPLIDYDERNPAPTWIHTEFAEKVRSQKMLEDMINRFTPVSSNATFDMDNVEFYINEMQGKRNSMFGPPNDDQREALQENLFIERLLELIMDYDLAVGDITRKANWGIYKGNPVLIDIGASNEIIQTFYR